MSMAVKASTGPNTPQAVLTRGLWHENPVLVQTLGLCSALAVTNAVANSLAMGLATAFVLVCSSAIVSLMSVNTYRQELSTLEADEGKAWAELEMLTGRELLGVEP